MKKQSLYDQVDGSYHPTPKQTEAVLRFLPKLEKRGFKAGRVVVPPRQPGQLRQLPYFVYNKVVDEFVQALYANGFVFPFNWQDWRTRHHVDRRLVRHARFQTVRKLLCAHVRADRFCEGHLAAVIEDGFIPAVLRRLEELDAKL
jgi:hypothetical protein